MKKLSKIIGGLTALLLLCFCANSWSAEDRISTLQEEISALEQQKEKLEVEKQKLTDEGNELSLRIEELKMQSKGGLGIIGRFRLTRRLRKAQSLSEKVQILQKDIYDVESEIGTKRIDLEREYERQIAILMENLNDVSQTEAWRRKILEKLREYQAAKEQLIKPAEEETEHLDLSKIDIEEYDGPKEIREKADLINDGVSKLNQGIETLNARIKKLEEEFRTREKLGEFAEEISFFGGRISREEVASAAEKKPDDSPVEEPDVVKPDDNVLITAEPPGSFTREVDAVDKSIPIVPITESGSVEKPSLITEVEAAAPPGKMVVERNGISAVLAGTSLEQMENMIRMMEKRKQDLEKQAAALSRKAKSFHKKADEIEKSETETGAKEH